MNSLILHLSMLISFPADSLPLLERIATEFNITVEEAAERVVVEKINMPGFYWYLDDKEEVQEHPYY